MKSLMIIVLALAVIFGAAVISEADVYVRGYTRSSGTYVAPHYRSNPDSSLSNNWSTYPNINPHTGKRGSRRAYGY